MNLNDDLIALKESLTRQRDEIELRLHLAGMEAKELWHQTEPAWARFIDHLGVINDDSRETTAELIHTTKVIGDELKETYRRITNRLSE